MQTVYSTQHRKAIKGLALCAPRRARPRQLPWLPQITRMTIAGGAGTSDVTITVVDDKTGQTFSCVAAGSATEATLLANVLAAVRADPEINALFTVADGGTATDVIVDFTARYGNHAYTLSGVGGASGAAAAATIASVQSPGGSGLAFGVLVARGTADDEFQAMSSTTTVADIVGALVRTDANHFHSRENDTPSAIDASDRGRHYPIAEEVEMWVEVEEAVTPASRVYVRVEGGTIGAWGDSPGGTAQTLTVTPVVNRATYGFSFGVVVNGRRYEIDAFYQPTDATTSIADACAGLFDAVTADIAAKGLSSFLTPTDNATTLTIAGASGILIDEPSVNVWTDDTEAASATASVSTADVDMLDVSSIARYTSSASAGQLATVKVRINP